MTQPRKVSHSYYVVAIDYGRNIEAIVDPEMTRRGVVSRIRSREYKDIAFIHHIDGLFVEDVTADLLAAAGQPDIEIDHAPLAARFDHARDLRKHEVA